jgi:ABC-2 type transport system permease protein
MDRQPPFQPALRLKGSVMKFLDLAIKDLYQIVKDWKTALIFLVAAPILFTLLFGFMFGGFSGTGSEDADNRLPLWLDTTEETPITDSFLSYLQSSPVVRVEKLEETPALAELKQAVADQDIAAVLLLPENFSQVVREEGRLPLDLILEKNTTAGIAIQQEVQSAASRLQSAAHAASLAVQTFNEKGAGFTSAGEQEAFFDLAFDRALSAWQDPPVRSERLQTAPDGEQQTSEGNAFAQSLPGMMAQFAIAGLIGAAEIIVQERKSGALSRLLGTAVSKASILAGHWLAMFGMIFLQFIVLVAFGQIFLRLNFLGSPLATLALSIASCAFVASLGLLIGILAKLPEQTAIFALVPMFLFAGVGGAWVPIDILGEMVQKVSRFTPVYWMMSGFKDILLRGVGLDGVLLSSLVLWGFSALFFIPAAILFYRKQTS